MDKRISSGISLGIILLMAIFIASFLWLSNYKETKIRQETVLKNDKLSREAICSQEVKVCPDGTEVSRIGTNCEFSPCPNEFKNSNEGDSQQNEPKDKKELGSER